MSNNDLCVETDDTITNGAVKITVDDQGKPTFDPPEVEPNDKGEILMTLYSTGPNEFWTFDPRDPINISNPHDFSWGLRSPTELLVSDTSADRKVHPKHNYTVKLDGLNGRRIEVDPVIKDRPTPPEL